MTEIRVPLPEHDASGGRVIITSPYGPRWGRLHAGVDLGTTDGIEMGTPACAPVDGQIVHIQDDGPSPSAGLNLWFLGDDGTRWKFFHLRRVTLPAGTHVRAGMQIAEVGMSGTEAPHLHLEQHVGSWSNPVDCTQLVRDAIAAGRFGLQATPPSPPPTPQPEDDDMPYQQWTQQDKDALKADVLAPTIAALFAQAQVLAAVCAKLGIETEWDQGVLKLKG